MFQSDRKLFHEGTGGVFLPIFLLITGHRGVVTRSKRGKIMVTRGYYINLVELRGNPPATFGRKGNYCDPSGAAVPLAPTTGPKKIKRRACVLGMGCGHLASASYLNLEPVGARGNVSPRRVFPILPYI